MSKQPVATWQSLGAYGYDWLHETEVLTSAHRPASLCYICQDDRVLLLQRQQPPFVGYWTAPGGKVQPGESPHEAVQREVKEETGLRIAQPALRMIVVESGPHCSLNWLLFIFRSAVQGGRLQVSNEGPLQWVNKDELHTVGMPAIDLMVSRYVLTNEAPYWAEAHFDENARTKEWRVVPLHHIDQRKE